MIRIAVYLLFILTDSLFTENVLAAKRWPESGVRGVASILIAKQRANYQDPGEYLSEATFSQLAAWGVNMLRVELQMDEQPLLTTSLQHRQAPVQEGGVDLSMYSNHFEALEVALALAEKYKIHILLLASKVSGRDAGILYSASGSQSYYLHLLNLWTYVAKRFGNHPWLIGYDFLGEPHTTNEIEYWHSTVLPILIRAVRQYDKIHMSLSSLYRMRM